MNCLWRIRALLVGIIMAGGGCAVEQQSNPPAPVRSEAAPTGRIRGIVRLRGSSPTPAFERIAKDHAVCGTEVPVTRLAVGTDNGVKHAFVYVENAPASEALRPRAAVTLEQTRCEYAPHALTVPVGTKLEIVNSDPILHNVHAKPFVRDQPSTIFNIAQPLRGQRTLIEPPLSAPGIIEVTCEAGHPWMTGYILVANHPYTAVTGEDGGFEIADVPPGTYQIRMWHEGVRLKNILASVQRYEYEDPYEITREVVLPPAGEVQVNFNLELRGS